MPDWACNRGCFECGPEGERLGHPVGCCGSTLCYQPLWDRQVQLWLEAEERYKAEQWLAAEVEHIEKVDAWLAAEVEFREELRARPKVHVKYVPREMQREKDPVEERAKARAR